MRKLGFITILLTLFISACTSTVDFKISFDSNGGSLVEPITTDGVSSITTPKDPVKEGYKFAGWYTSVNDGVTLDERWSFTNNLVNNDITLYAKWNINTYTITFDTNGSTEIEPIILDYNADIVLPDDPIYGDIGLFNGNISVYIRDIYSSSVDSFMSKIGLEDAWYDDSLLVDDFVIADNSETIAAIQENEYAIGYVSLSDLNSQLFKGLNFEGVAPTESNVLNGTYKLSRNFNYMLRDDYSHYGANADAYEELSKAFVAYMGSSEGLAIIKTAGGIVDLSSGQSWNTLKTQFPICGQDNSGYTLKFGGSDSVENIATALSNAFKLVCGNVVTEHIFTGSSNAYRGLNGNFSKIGLAIHVGFASREFKDSEPAIVTGRVAIDALVAVVHLDNPINNVSANDLKSIYSGEVLKWSEITNLYTFDGWYTDQSFTTKYSFTTMPAENLVLYGRWSEVENFVYMTLDELSVFDGKNGVNAYIAYNGVIYDVTNNPNWPNGVHRGYINAGQDVTQLFQTAGASHDASNITNLPIVGYLEEE